MTWPLWYCLSPRSRSRLRWYQWRQHRQRVTPPDYGIVDRLDYPILETLQEIDRLMRKPPSKSRGQRS